MEALGAYKILCSTVAKFASEIYFMRDDSYAKILSFSAAKNNQIWESLSEIRHKGSQWLFINWFEIIKHAHFYKITSSKKEDNWVQLLNAKFIGKDLLYEYDKY